MDGLGLGRCGTADLLSKLGRFDEARAEFQRAAERAQNGRERTLLLQRAEACRQA